MKLYRRPATRTPTFRVVRVREWNIEAFGAWQDLLAASGAPVPSASDYCFEDTRDHYLALDGDTMIGTLQVVADTEGRIHLHRLVVRPADRNAGVAQELVRHADFHYDDTELWAFAEDDNPLASLLDLYLFEEVTDAVEPKVRAIGGVGDRVRAGDPGPAGAPGGGGGGQPPVDGPDAPGEDPQAAVGVRGEDGGGDQRHSGRRPRKRGKRGGRKRK